MGKLIVRGIGWGLLLVLLATSSQAGSLGRRTLPTEIAPEELTPETPPAAVQPQPPAARPRLPRGVTVRLPGEFEPHHALLVSCHNLVWDEPELFAQLVAAAQPHVQVVAAVRNVADYREAMRLLAQQPLPAGRVHFAEWPHDTMWTRDYGPMIAQRYDGRAVVLDADYSRHARPADDALPRLLGDALRLTTTQVPLEVDGGNLLSNGCGLLIGTHDLLHANLPTAQSEKQVRQLFREYYGATQVVFLEPLSGEPTGHVDMFATFTSPTTVVVGAYDLHQDPTNAAILDRNAAQLAAVVTPLGPLQVVRIPMPPNRDSVWRSYTNVTFANGALLMPSYPDLDATGRARALAVYRQLLPGWKIVPIDARSVSQLGGALHCVTMNLGVIRRLPKFPPPQQIEAAGDPGLARALPGVELLQTPPSAGRASPLAAFAR